MRRTPLITLIVSILLSALLIGCTPPKVEKAKTSGETSEKIISKDQAIGGLPCFRCHSFDKFSAQPAKGVFTHQRHITTGFHCNQCHDFHGHKHISINKDVCNNCHNMRTVTFNKTVMPSRFNHEGHTKMFSCKECHPGLFLMKAGTATITMKEINKGVYCGACHNGKKAFSAGECSKCHKMKGFDRELVYTINGMGPVTFSHKFHTAAFSCDNCHPKLFAMKKTHGKMTMDAMNTGKYCGGCHNGNVATAVSDCGKCHK